MTLTFEDVKVPVANRIGQEGEGFMIAMATLDNSRPLTAMFAIGIARAAMEHAIDYAKQRQQFGKPIAEFQAIQFMIADMAADIEASRLLTYKSAWLLDDGQRNTLVSSYAKRFAADMGMKAATDAVQIFGGYGYSPRVPGGEADARRQAHPDLRGHQPGAAPRDRPRAAQGQLREARFFSLRPHPLIHKSVSHNAARQTASLIEQGSLRCR